MIQPQSQFPSSNTPPLEKKNSKLQLLMIIIGVVVLLFILIGVGYFLYIKNNPQSNPQTGQSYLSQPTGELINTSSSITINNSVIWKAYVNTKYRYVINYPGSYTVNRKNCFDCLDLAEKNLVVFIPTNNTDNAELMISASEFKNQSETDEQHLNSVIQNLISISNGASESSSIKKETINGVNALVVTKVTNKIKRIFLVQNGRSIEIVISRPSSILEEMISSFRFLDQQFLLSSESVPKEVTWSKAIDILNEGKVQSGVLGRNGSILLHLKDTSEITTTEPNGKDILEEIKKCGDLCKHVGLLMPD